MLIGIVIGRRPDGHRVIAEFDLRLHYSSEPFDYSSRSFSTEQNIREITTRYDEIDRTNVVDLVGTTPVRIGRVDLMLDGKIYFYNQGERLLWYPRRATNGQAITGYWPLVHGRIHEQLRNVYPVVVGTVRLRLADIKQETQDQIRRYAVRRALVMRANAEAILHYLNEPFD